MAVKSTGQPGADTRGKRRDRGSDGRVCVLVAARTRFGGIAVDRVFYNVRRSRTDFSEALVRVPGLQRNRIARWRRCGGRLVGERGWICRRNWGGDRDRSIADRTRARPRTTILNRGFESTQRKF